MMNYWRRGRLMVCFILEWPTSFGANKLSWILHNAEGKRVSGKVIILPEMSEGEIILD